MMFTTLSTCQHEEANVCTIVAGNVDHQVHRREATRGVIYNPLNKHEWIIKYGKGDKLGVYSYKIVILHLLVPSSLLIPYTWNPLYCRRNPSKTCAERIVTSNVTHRISNIAFPEHYQELYIQKNIVWNASRIEPTLITDSFFFLLHFAHQMRP